MSYIRELKNIDNTIAAVQPSSYGCSGFKYVAIATSFGSPSFAFTTWLLHELQKGEIKRLVIKSLNFCDLNITNEMNEN